MAKRHRDFDRAVLTGEVRPLLWCHCASDILGYSLKHGSLGLPSILTHRALEPTRQCTFSGGTGSGVSIAPAWGWTSSGQVGSHTHSALPQPVQKCRRAVLTRVPLRP